MNHYALMPGGIEPLIKKIISMFYLCMKKYEPLMPGGIEPLIKKNVLSLYF